MLKLLVVDDEPLTREYISKEISISYDNWEVAGEAMDGAEALEILSNTHIDLVITDIKMPFMDGLQLCKFISENYHHIKVIILSGYDEFSFAQEAMRYGINEYLLKPIVKKDLHAAVAKVTQKIENDNKNEKTFKVVSNLSEDYKSFLVRNVLKAIISNSDVEIKSLYPLTHRLKIDIINNESIVMVLCIDEDTLLEKLIPYRDLSIYRYILFQIATEVLEANDSYQVFLDSDENTVVFVTMETSSEILEGCKSLYNKISSFFYENTEISITATIGSLQNELLQVNISYMDAMESQLLYFVKGGNSLYSSTDVKDSCSYIENLESCIDNIKLEVLTNNEIGYCTSIWDYINIISIKDTKDVLRYGIHLIKSIKEIKKDCTAELLELAYKEVQSCVSTKIDISSKEAIMKLYCSLVKIFIDNPLSIELFSNEQNIINQVKDYIYSHYAEPISLAQIAENIGITSGYLSSLFHKCMGETYSKYLTKTRMEQAVKLLKLAPPVKIYDVSEKVGYVSVKHFSYVFKQYFHTSPGEYQSKYFENLLINIKK